MTKPLPEPSEYSETDLRWIVQRATSLDGLMRSQLSQAEIESIGAELGLSPAAIAAAVDELHARRREAPAVGLGLTLPLGLALAGVMGVVAVLVDEGLATKVIVATATVSLVLAADASTEKAYRKYLMRAGGLWGGFVAGISAAYSIAPSMWLFVGGLLAAGVGTVAVVRRIVGSPSDGGAAQPPSGLHPWTRAAASRARSWLISYLERNGIVKSAAAPNAPWAWWHRHHGSHVS